MSLSQLNIEMFRGINDLGKQFSFLNPSVVFIAEYTLYMLAACMLLFWFTRTTSNRMMVLQAGFAFILAEIIGKAVSMLHSHHQPFAVLPQVSKLINHAIDNSFPSDHTILFFSVCVSFWLMRKRAGWVWLVLAGCVAISRVWVGVHYPVDIAAGAVIGIVSALIVYWSSTRFTWLSRLLDMYENMEQRVLPTKNKSNNM
ncbi:undecaprenyl-diphosphatase [Paenibacillus alvei]|uniref:Undecaprenyl-diphosphatase n=1 Tax=Paenibacillus alvei TaxID=44250 RepID=A0ABT4GTZ1_PAEAL|nr:MULTISPECIES: undecaprenyl-diphosphatase [Paenibacillus]EJW16370.1 membrane-associated phospholipid phosphatase [Paenibacillus alvei DSM 29]MCY9543071.1 undecaprenyl-diphosphatase [Paenibacillus alvei]MCY9707846.1 undecaprenyl-diphosphatase [Paenibacillus alvei]MCY9736301.1 undecaprenyl-diphosphatase [Paenibacillus alvei]MCY9756998.1 undecaprenyl-diphosphatase [Paenibacillus alvei]